MSDALLSRLLHLIETPQLQELLVVKPNLASIWYVTGPNCCQFDETFGFDPKWNSGMCERVFPLPIHYAALSGNLDAVRELIRVIGRERGGHPHNYVKAAFFCCWKGRRIVTEPQSVPWLNCPIQSRTGDTCLHLAVRLGQLPVVRFLIQEYPWLVVVRNDDSDLPIEVIVGSAMQGTVDSSTILDILWSLLTTEFTVQILAKSTTRELYSCQIPPIKYITVAGFLMKYTEYPTLAEHRHLQPVITGYVTGFSEKLASQCTGHDQPDKTA